MRHGAVNGDGKYFQVVIINGVDADLVKTLNIHQLPADAVDIGSAKLLERDVQDVGGLERAGSFLFDIVGDEGMGVAERFVPGKFRLGCGDQFIALKDILDAADGDASALFEKRTEHFAVDRPAEVGFLAFAKDLGFHWIMAAHGRIAPADVHVGDARFAC